MSKLIDKLSLAGGTAPKRMGFGAAAAPGPKQALILVASLAQAEVDPQIAASADALIMERPGFSSVTGLSGVIWGLRLDGTGQKAAEELANAGCDFLVFTRNAPLEFPAAPGMGKVLQVDESFSDGMLRSINGLPVDAVLVTAAAPSEDRLAWGDILFFKRITDLLTRPVLVTASPYLGADEMEMLWQAGVDGLVLPAIGDQLVRLKQMRQTVDGLTFPPRRGRKIEPILPRAGSGEETPEEEEEEE